eukprot:2275685-Rhodomonas_salina.1
MRTCATDTLGVPQADTSTFMALACTACQGVNLVLVALSRTRVLLTGCRIRTLVCIGMHSDRGTSPSLSSPSAVVAK